MLAYILRLRTYFARGRMRRDGVSRASGINCRSASLIADDLIIDGSLVSSGDVYLLGRVKGDLTCGNVFFGKRGTVDGAIQVRGRTHAANIEMIGVADVYFK